MFGEKLLIKMWGTLTKGGIGTLAAPWVIKRQGRAHAEVRKEELLIMAQTEIDVQAIREGKKIFTKDLQLIDAPSKSEWAIENSKNRCEPILVIDHFNDFGQRSRYATAIQEDININKTIIYAENILSKTERAASADEVDQDWLTRWRESASKVRSEQIQQIWAQALAGETICPGSFSLRTLDFLKNLSKQEAENISRLAPFAAIDAVYVSPEINKQGMDFSFLLEMEDLGILSGLQAGGLSRTIKSRLEEKFFQIIIVHNKVLLIEHEDPKKNINLKSYKVSSTGIQVMKLGDFKANIDHLIGLGNIIKKEGFAVKIADWINDNEDSGRYFDAVSI